MLTLPIIESDDASSKFTKTSVTVGGGVLGCVNTFFRNDTLARMLILFSGFDEVTTNELGIYKPGYVESLSAHSVSKYTLYSIVTADLCELYEWSRCMDKYGNLLSRATQLDD